MDTKAKNAFTAAKGTKSADIAFANYRKAMDNYEASVSAVGDALEKLREDNNGKPTNG